MGHLLGYISPAQVIRAIAFVRFAQQRIERFTGSIAGRRVTGNGESGHVGQLFAWICAFGGLVQQFGVLVVLGKALQHRQRFVEVDGHRDLGQIFADAVFHDRPQIQRIVGFLGHANAPLACGRLLRAVRRAHRNAQIG